MRILLNTDTGDMVMNRRDFIKICLASLAGLFLSNWKNPFEQLNGPKLTEARFYKRADDLAG